MEIKGTCQHCKENIAFPAEYAGERVECPHCMVTTLLRIPVAVPKAPEPILTKQNLKLIAALLFAILGIGGGIWIYNNRVDGLTQRLVGFQLPDFKVEHIPHYKTAAGRQEEAQKDIDDAVRNALEDYHRGDPDWKYEKPPP